MITRLDELAESNASADLCIVGAGPAGLEVARCFLGGHVRVMVLEGGDFDYNQRTQNLHRFTSIGKQIRSLGSGFNRLLPPELRTESRIRQFGGTSNIWSGNWKALAPDDFEPKDWIPHSGWPVSYDDLLPYYRAVVKDYDLPQSLLETRLGRTEMRDPYYKQSPPLNFGSVSRQTLEASINITVILNANVIRLVMDGTGSRIDHIVARSLQGKELCVSARAFVLAAGGLENARLLLGLNDHRRQAAGDSADLIGRFYMDHPKLRHGWLVADQPLKLRRFLRPTKGRRGMAIGHSHPRVLRESAALPNHRTEFVPTTASNEWDAWAAITSARRRRRWLTLLGLIAHPIFLSPKRFFRRLLLRSLGLAPRYELIHHLEQIPNADSRVFLSSEEKDEFGEPVLIVDWKLSENDLALFWSYLEILQAEIRRRRIGKVSYPAQEVDLDMMADAAHHMGTTRMGRSSRDGVVDKDCKVFGIDNLYVAGSSVFPTGGNANPMLTILALSRRLASHLDQVVIATRKEATLV